MQSCKKKIIFILINIYFRIIFTFQYSNYNKRSGTKSMYRFFRGVKKLIFSFSYFQASQYFRFRKDDAYVHSSAGLLSLALQIIITISLIYQLVAIFQRGSAFVTTFVSYSYPPSSTTISQSNFMAAIQTVTAISGLTVKFYQNNWSSGTNTKSLLGAAEACTLEHWTGSGVSLTSDDFSNNNMAKWYCMPKGASATLQGAKSSSSSTFSYLSIDIQCSGCTLSAPIQAIVRYKNALLNPTDGQNYLKNYIHSDNSMSISSSASYDVLSISLQDYTITSDTTVCAWYTFITEQGLIGTDTRVQKATRSSSTYFSQVIFKKSAKSTTYTRNIPKILDAFYFIIGSFAPTVLAFAFFIYPILSSIFEMRFAKYVYRLEEGKSFGLLSYFKQNFYSIFRNICSLKSQRWKRWEKTLQVREILSKVMEIQYLYERIDFLERSMKFLFKDHHLCGLHLMKKDSIVDAEVKYKTYQIRKAIKNYVISGQIKQIQQIKKSSKSIPISKTQKQIESPQPQVPVTERIQSEMINPLKFNFENVPKKSTTKFEGTKQFQINKLDYEGEKMCQQIQENRQYYTKLVQDFKKLKREAHSYDSEDYVSKMIYDDLKQNDIDLMEEFERRIKASKAKQDKDKNKDNLDKDGKSNKPDKPDKPDNSDKPEIPKRPDLPKRPQLPKKSGKSQRAKKDDDEQKINPMRSQSMLHSDVRIYYDEVVDKKL